MIAAYRFSTCSQLDTPSSLGRGYFLRGRPRHRLGLLRHRPARPGPRPRKAHLLPQRSRPTTHRRRGACDPSDFDVRGSAFSGTACSAVGRLLDGGDVQVGRERPSVAGQSDEQAAFHDGHRLGITDGVGLAARRDHAERLERITFQSFANIVNDHGYRIASTKTLEQTQTHHTDFLSRDIAVIIAARSIARRRFSPARRYRLRPRDCPCRRSRSVRGGRRTSSARGKRARSCRLG